MMYNDYCCKKIADDYYLVFIIKDVGNEEEVGGFTKGQIFIYPKYKDWSLGYLIRLFMEENGAV